MQRKKEILQKKYLKAKEKGEINKDKK